MPFINRVTETPALANIQQIEQVIIVDKTGPSITLGKSTGAACLVGEFVKGPFTPLEVFSQGDIDSIYGKFYQYLSQTSVGGTNDGGGLYFDGNGIAELKGKTFKRLAIQRTDMDMVKSTTTAKAFVQFTLAVAAAEQDSTKTALDIVIPAGTRFGDDATGTNVIVALSQDIKIPKGTTHSGGNIVISATVSGGPLDLVQDATTGQLSMPINSSGTKTGGTFGATCFFVKGVSAIAGNIDTCIDTALPGYTSVLSATGVSTVDAAGSACAVTPPTGTGTLQEMAVTQTIAAIAKTVPGSLDITNDITVIWSARNDVLAATTTLRAALWANAVNSSKSSRGRIACIASTQGLGTDSTSFTNAKTAIKAIQAAITGVDADRCSINGPYVKVYSTELGRAIQVSPSGFKASLFSNLAEEYESGVANSYLTNILGFEDCYANNALTIDDYISFRSKGVSFLLKDKAVGWWFQSSVTAVVGTTYPTRVKDNRRRFADFVQDTLAGIVSKYNKMPGTTERLDAIAGEFDSFLSSLVSANNPSQQRMEAYRLDMKSANTPTLTGLGIWTFIIQCRMLGDLDDIILQTEIGPTVVITQTA